MRIYICLLLIKSSIVYNSVGQSCLNRSPSDKKGKLYEYKFRKNRCEGFHMQEAGNIIIKLCNMTYGQFIYELDPNEIITIEIPHQPDTLESQVNATSIKRRLYYSMDANLIGNKSLEWILGDVVYPNKISHNHIGIFGVHKNINDTYFVPVKYSSKEFGNRYYKRDEIVVVLGVLHDIIDIEYTLFEYSSGNPISLLNEFYELNIIREGRAFSLHFNNLQNGIYTLQIRAKKRFSLEEFTREFKFLIF